MFRGYVLTKKKRCIEPFKGIANCNDSNAKQRLKTYDEVKGFTEFAGILDGNTILLDFDDAKQAEKALQIVQDLKLKCRVHKTARGVHVFFRNTAVDRCGTGMRLACGLRADIKVGLNSYALLKENGQERPVLFDSGELEEVPKFFVPLSSTVELMGLNEGDARNQNLFKYILPLQKHGFDVGEAKNCLHIINKYVFDMPLPEREMKSIMRDGSFKDDMAPVFHDDKKKFMFDKFAEYVRDKVGIVKINGQLHMYKDGIYVDSRGLIESEMIRLVKGLRRSQRTEVIDYLDILITENKEQSPPHLIAFKNGVYDVIHDILMPFSEKYVITNKINHNFNVDAKSELVDATLDKLACGDAEIRALLEEAIGYCFFRRNELGKSFILVGDGTREKGASNGKSTFLTTVKALLGENNITSLDMSELNQKFQNAELFGKLANIGDDIDDGYIPNSAIFKKLVTGERIQVQRKGERPFEFNNYAKMLFSANEIPKIKDRGGAIQRRLVIIPFLAHFSKNDPDYRPYITTELQESENLEYLIQLGVQGLKRVLENNAFTESAKVQNQLDEFEEANNPIVGFLNENPKLEVENQTTKSIYDAYKEYCWHNQFHPISNITFSKQVKQRFGLEIATVWNPDSKKPERVFVKK